MADALAALFEKALQPYEERRKVRETAAPSTTTIPPMVLTVWQPWAWALLYGTKRIENRGQITSFRGRLLIHVGQGPSKGWDEYVAESIAAFPPGRRPTIQALQAQLGKVIGEVTLYDVRPPSADPLDPWAVPGQWQWLVKAPKLYANPFTIRGQQGLFRLPPEGTAGLAAAKPRVWVCDQLDITTGSPWEAATAYQLAGARGVLDEVTVNGKVIYMGSLWAMAARWNGEERLARSLEDGVREWLGRALAPASSELERGTPSHAISSSVRARTTPRPILDVDTVASEPDPNATTFAGTCQCARMCSCPIEHLDGIAQVLDTTPKRLLGDA